MDAGTAAENETANEADTPAAPDEGLEKIVLPAQQQPDMPPLPDERLLSDDQIADQQAHHAARVDQRDAVKAAAKLGEGDATGSLTPEALKSALDWFLSDEEIPMEYRIDVKIGPPNDERPMVWTIRPIESGTLKEIRSVSELGNRGRKRALAAAGAAPEVDDLEMNSRIVVAGSVEPDLIETSLRRGADPKHPDKAVAAVELLQHRLRHKPGLIDLLAGEILRLSGYDDENIAEHAAGKA